MKGSVRVEKNCVNLCVSVCVCVCEVECVYVCARAQGNIDVEFQHRRVAEMG